MNILCPLAQEGDALGPPFQRLLWVSIHNAADWMRVHPQFPLLYSIPPAKLRYAPEPNAGSGIEEFANPKQVLARGWGDCDDLVIFRGAELIVRGFPCHARILRKTENNHYHTQLTRDFDELTEDPSLQRLGKPYVYRTNDLSLQPMANPPYSTVKT